MKHLVKLLAVLMLTGSAFAQQQVQPVAGVLTLNLIPGTTAFKVILAANVTSVVIVNPTPGTTISIIFTENATGGFTVVFGGNIANPCSVATAANTTTTCQFQYDATSNTWNGIGGAGATNTSSIPGQAGLNAVPITSGLMAEYRILPSESACAIVDYSGNNNNATGCTGTPPTINTVTGGLAANGAGAVNLPSALNSAQTVVLFIGNTAGNANGGLIAGNGAAANSSIFSLTVFNNPSSTQGGQVDQSFAAGSRIFAGQMGGGNNLSIYPRIMVEGNVSVAWDMICDAAHATFDTIYINGLDRGTPSFSVGDNSYLQQRCSQGHQTAGNYQLLGIASASCPNYTGCNFMNSGSIYYAAFWNRPLNAAEVASVSQYMATAMQARGVTPTIFASTGGIYANSMTVAIDGDSLSCGSCSGSSPLPVAPYSSYLTLTNPTAGSINITNMARVGYRLDQNLAPSAGFAIDPIYRPNFQNNVVVIWGGTNDGNGAGTISELTSYALARRAVGWKVIVATMISRTGLDATKNAYNAAIRQLWPTFSDGLVDIAADVNLGADGANASATYFTTDHVHVQDVGIINDETPWIQRAINRLYGNRDFSAATAYVAAATAAVATTAGSESTNTVTLTSAATPANCNVGNIVTVAGTTPAGYSGNWLIRTRSATQITYFAATAGMGAITVQGTLVCPQQQDADQYQIVNFGAGNYSLQSCVGYTGQNIYIRNINAAATTLLPFASETITGAGAAPTTLAANTTAILQSQLVSASAAGCNWVRLQ